MLEFCCQLGQSVYKGPCRGTGVSRKLEEGELFRFLILVFPSRFSGLPTEEAVADLL